MKARWWLLALGGLIVAAVTVSLIIPASRHQWAISIVRQPTNYTTLYFDNPATLPTTAEVNKPIGFSFTVVNHEGRALHYQYVVSSKGQNGAVTVQRSTRFIPAGASSSISTSVSPTSPGKNSRIVVSLPGHAETIDFLVAVTDPGQRNG